VLVGGALDEGARFAGPAAGTPAFFAGETLDTASVLDFFAEAFAAGLPCGADACLTAAGFVAAFPVTGLFPAGLLATAFAGGATGFVLTT
jgi:hypothetical protein